MLFNASAVPSLLDFIAANFTSAPADWLVRDWLQREQLRAFVHRPSVFQHVGSNTFKEGQVRMHRDFAYNKRQFVPSPPPPPSPPPAPPSPPTPHYPPPPPHLVDFSRACWEGKCEERDGDGEEEEDKDEEDEEEEVGREAAFSHSSFDFTKWMSEEMERSIMLHQRGGEA